MAKNPLLCIEIAKKSQTINAYKVSDNTMSVYSDGQLQEKSTADPYVQQANPTQKVQAGAILGEQMNTDSKVVKQIQQQNNQKNIETISKTAKEVQKKTITDKNEYEQEKEKQNFIQKVKKAFQKDGEQEPLVDEKYTEPVVESLEFVKGFADIAKKTKNSLQSDQLNIQDKTYQLLLTSGLTCCTIKSIAFPFYYWYFNKYILSKIPNKEELSSDQIYAKFIEFIQNELQKATTDYTKYQNDIQSWLDILQVENQNYYKDLRKTAETIDDAYYFANLFQSSYNYATDIIKNTNADLLATLFEQILATVYIQILGTITTWLEEASDDIINKLDNVLTDQIKSIIPDYEFQIKTLKNLYQMFYGNSQQQEYIEQQVIQKLIDTLGPEKAVEIFPHEEIGQLLMFGKTPEDSTSFVVKIIKNIQKVYDKLESFEQSETYYRAMDYLQNTAYQLQSTEDKNKKAGIKISEQTLIEFSKYIKDDANYLSNQTQYNERSFAKRSEKELIEEFKNTFKIFVETENINVLNAYIDKLIIEFSYDNNSVYIIFNIYQIMMLYYLFNKTYNYSNQLLNVLKSHIMQEYSNFGYVEQIVQDKIIYMFDSKINERNKIKPKREANCKETFNVGYSLISTMDINFWKVVQQTYIETILEGVYYQLFSYFNSFISYSETLAEFKKPEELGLTDILDWYINQVDALQAIIKDPAFLRNFEKCLTSYNSYQELSDDEKEMLEDLPEIVQYPLRLIFKQAEATTNTLESFTNNVL